MTFKKWQQVILVVLQVALIQAQTRCFQDQYARDKLFAVEASFANVSDITINIEQQHVLVLQRSHPVVTVWSTNGSILFSWSVLNIGKPHSITLKGSDPELATVWITDMYNHCIKKFTYHGQFLQSIGKCGQYTNGSGLSPLQFDLVTDVAFDSRGYIYITDGDLGGLNNRVLVLNQNNQLVDVWNKENQPSNGTLQFNLPHSIVVDKCDRLWIVDTNNHRIQTISHDGTFLSQWNCFGKALPYGIDFSYQKNASFVIVTTMTNGSNPEILFIPFNTNSCVNLKDIGTCMIARRLALSNSMTVGSMLHAVAFNDKDSALYATELPGRVPPLKFQTIPQPPVNNMKDCPQFTDPPSLLPEWTATVLLTPFHASALQTAQVEYSAPLNAMYIVTNALEQTKRYLIVGNETCSLENTWCPGGPKTGWIVPKQDWLVSHQCECKGSLEITGVQTKAWRCPLYKTVDWYWFSENDSPWRIFFSNQTNPSRLPLLGDFALVHFASYESGTHELQAAYDMYVNKMKRKELRQHHTIYPLFMGHHSSFVKGLSAGCSVDDLLPNWPQQMHIIVTMVPVLPGLENPLPTSVAYDWKRQSQRTIMCESSLVYNAYLIVNNTYITNHFNNGTIECVSHLQFGPPKPNWMTLDNCTCMGTITDNPSLSPWHLTTIAVCPLIEDRVFWTWFSNDTGFSPLLFAETLTPPTEGTGLSLADYHRVYSNDVLIDQLDFNVPSQCTR